MADGKIGRIPLPGAVRARTVLVTGASGFIGSHLCRSLLRRGARVHGISRNPKEADDGIRWWKGDISQAETARALFREIKPDFVFHLASHVMGSPALVHVLPTFQANLQTSVNLLTAAAETGCRRLIMAGSLSEPEPADGEETPSCPYAAAKWASTVYARMFHALYEVPVVSARIFMVYGPEQKDHSKLVPYVTMSLLREETPSITSGRRMVDWVYVDDVVEGLIAAAVTPGLEGSTVELGSGRLVSIADLVNSIAYLVGSKTVPHFGALPDRPMEPIRVADVRRTFRQLRWKPTIPLVDGLRLTVDWYRDLTQTQKGSRT